MPARMQLLSLNSRIHYRERNRRTAVLKDAACVLARQQRIPALERISVLVEYQPPDRRRRDADNAATASGKPCIDGLVMAGVIADDESPRYVTEVTYRIGPLCPGGRLVLTITEVADNPYEGTGWTGAEVDRVLSEQAARTYAAEAAAAEGNAS